MSHPKPLSKVGAYKFVAPYWHHTHAEKWLEMLKHLDGTHCQLLEIGSLEGGSALWVADNLLSHPDSRVTCIDNWPKSTREKQFDRNRSLCKRGSQIIKWKGNSQDVLPKVAGAFEFIYIDGSHEGRDVMRDWMLCYPLVKPGGLICFDDYEWSGDRRRFQTPKPAIDSILVLWADKIQLLDKAYQVWVRKLK